MSCHEFIVVVTEQDAVGFQMFPETALSRG